MTKTIVICIEHNFRHRLYHNIFMSFIMCPLKVIPTYIEFPPLTRSCDGVKIAALTHQKIFMKSNFHTTQDFSVSVESFWGW